MAVGEQATETTGDKIRAAIAEKFRQLRSQGRLQAAARKIEVRHYQSLQQWAGGVPVPADVFLLACLRLGWTIDFEDISAEDHPQVEFRFRQRQKATGRDAAPAEQLPLFQAIDDLAPGDLEVKIARKFVDRIELAVDIRFKKTAS